MIDREKEGHVAEDKEDTPAAAGRSLAESPPAALPPDPPHETRCLIMGIGASAGGLEALTAFFAHMSLTAA
jgi:chemotaxis response regulator CheB